MAKRAAVFLDRDGVILRFVHHLSDPDRVRLLAGAAEAVRSLRRAGYRVIVVSNQSAVARGLLDDRGLAEIHARMVAALRLGGTRLDAAYYCRHHPDFGRRCRCRKPGTAMLEAAARRFGLDIRSSWLVGDATVDLRTARNAGCAGLLVRTGLGGRDRKFPERPTRSFRNLLAAARWILRRGGR